MSSIEAQFDVPSLVRRIPSVIRLVVLFSVLIDHGQAGMCVLPNYIYKSDLLYSSMLM